MSNYAGVLCLPSHTSRWFQGRVFTPTSRLLLLGVDQVHQHPCLTPSDGSFVLVDIGLQDEEGKNETVICGVEKTGGSLCALNLGVEFASFRFQPRLCFVDEAGMKIASHVFPDIPLSPDIIVVEGDFYLDERLLKWRPQIGDRSDRESGAGKASMTDAAHTFLDLVTRRWEPEIGCFCETGGSCSKVDEPPLSCCTIDSVDVTRNSLCEGIPVHVSCGWIEPRSNPHSVGTPSFAPL